MGIVSPDGRWLAYEADNSGRYEVYVRPYSNVGSSQSQVSAAGGLQPVWARNGKALYFFGGDGSLMEAPVEAQGARWGNGTPITDLDASEMLRELTTFPLLDGYRGGVKMDAAAIEDVLLRVSALVEDHPSMAELDLNPLMALPRGAVVVDARIRAAAPGDLRA